MSSTTEARIALRQHDFMGAPDFQSSFGPSFAITLRKEKRQQLASQNRDQFRDQDHEELPKLSLLPNYSTMSFSDQMKLLLSYSPATQQDQESLIREVGRLCSKENNFELSRHPTHIRTLVGFLSVSYSDELSFQVLKIFTKLLSGNTKSTKVAISSIGLSNITDSLCQSKPKTAEQAIWALANIAGDCSELRDDLISKQIHLLVLSLCRSCKLQGLYKAVAFFLMNICRSQNTLPSPDLEQILSVLKVFLYQQEDDVLERTLLALELSCKNNIKKIQAILNLNLLDRILELTMSASLIISEAALKVIGNCSYGDNGQVQKLIDSGVLKYLEKALGHSQAIMRKEALFTLSNMIANGPYFIQYVIEHHVCDLFIEKLKDTDFGVKKEISFILFNISMIGSHEQVRILVEKSVFSGLKYALRNADSELLKNFLRFIKKSLDYEENSSDKPIQDNFYDSGCLEVVERLQKYMNPVIFELVLAILRYFSSEDDIEMTE